MAARLRISFSPEACVVDPPGVTHILRGEEICMESKQSKAHIFCLQDDEPLVDCLTWGPLRNER